MLSATSLLTCWPVIVNAASAAPAPISSVVVYADRAQVTRTRAADCGAGEAIFEGLPSTLDPKTLSAEISGNGEVVGIKYREEATGPRDNAKGLQAQVRQIDVALVGVRDRIEAAAAVESKLQSFRAHLRRTWQIQAVGKRPQISTWNAALDLLQKQALEAAKQRREAQVRRRELQRKRDELRLQLQQIKRARRRTTLRVTAVLKCSGTPLVRLSYVVPDATWRITYQLRADEQQRKITLVAEAVVAQGTGEDWSNVSLAVSTANLQRKNTPPSVRPMRVSTRKPQSTRKVLARRFEHRKHLKAAAGKQTPGAGAAQPARGPAGKPQEGLAMQLSAATRVTIPSDGRQVVVTLATRTVTGRRAGFVFETVPKLYPYVYRKVSLANPFSFPMLAGRVSIYRGRTFIGRASIKLHAPGEPVELSLGVHNQLQVRRYVKTEKLEGASTFGSSKKLLHRYAIEVGNWTGRRQKIRVLENIPVSQVREIKVSLDGGATKPTSHDRTDGIATWELSLAPRSKRTIIVAYTIDVPKSYIVTGY